MANISLEMSVRWLSEDVVCFEIEVGVYEKFAKYNNDFDFLLCKQQALQRQKDNIDFFAGY